MQNKTNLLEKEKTTKQNRIWVRIAASCNNKCIFCLDSNAHDGTFVENNIVLKQIKDGYKEGFENRVIISGGEASIDPKFTEYIKYAKKIGYDRVQTVTNGNMFVIERFCRKVFDAGLEEVTFSFHGHNAKLHDYLVDTPGAFKKSLKGLIYIKKYFPNVIINIDIVVNKINVSYLPDIVKFFMKLGVYEYDILQIIPFGRGFHEHRDKLFYNLEDYSDKLTETWQLSKTHDMYMWTNRFPAEAFEGYEDLIQDPRKIKSEVMGEGRHHFEPFITSGGKELQECYKKACDICFQNQYCNDFIKNQNVSKIENNEIYYVLIGKEFPSDVYKKYGETKEDFIKFLRNKKEKLVNVPKCLGGTGIFETYNDIKKENTIEDYTEKYINTLYRKKSLRCKKCKYYKQCEGLHINFIRSYGFSILSPKKGEN
ncbi:MAG: radical SAM protein [Candidatus Gracilibacteria bacterium]